MYAIRSYYAASPVSVSILIAPVEPSGVASRMMKLSLLLQPTRSENNMRKVAVFQFIIIPFRYDFDAALKAYSVNFALKSAPFNMLMRPTGVSSSTACGANLPSRPD